MMLKSNLVTLLTTLLFLQTSLAVPFVHWKGTPTGYYPTGTAVIPTGTGFPLYPTAPCPTGTSYPVYEKREAAIAAAVEHAIKREELHQESVRSEMAVAGKRFGGARKERRNWFEWTAPPPPPHPHPHPHGHHGSKPSGVVPASSGFAWPTGTGAPCASGTGVSPTGGAFPTGYLY